MPARRNRPGVYIEESVSGARSISGASTSVAAFVGSACRGPVNKATRILSFTDYQRRFGGLHPTSEMSFAVFQLFLNGGSEAWVVRVASKTGKATYAPDPSSRKGIYALDAVDTFNLLCLPGVTEPATLSDASAYSKSRRAFLIADCRQNLTPEKVAGDAASAPALRSDHAAIYYPWIKIGDPLNQGMLRTVSPSGSIAGLYARTDGTRGVWKAPAGTGASIVGAQGVERELADTEIEVLSRLGVNSIRLLPVGGVVSWGARTLIHPSRAASEYKYIPVRRLALFIEESLDRGTTWAVFEPNDEPLWAQLRLHAGAFLQDLFRQGAFQGQIPRDAYFVKCDRETTTQNDISLGVVNIVVGFAPLKPAEFVIIKISQIAGRSAA